MRKRAHAKRVEAIAEPAAGKPGTPVPFHYSFKLIVLLRHIPDLSSFF
jgi:hypothetical protein